MPGSVTSKTRMLTIGGLNFKASEHLARHPEFNWEKGLLRDLNSRDWTEFAPSGKSGN